MDRIIAIILHIYGSIIDNLLKFSNLNYLKEIWISDTNQLSDIPPFAGCDNLIETSQHVTEGLFFDGCAACDLDFKSLGRLSQIKIFYLAIKNYILIK